MFIEKLIAMNSDKDVSKAELYYNSSTDWYRLCPADIIQDQ